MYTINFKSGASAEIEDEYVHLLLDELKKGLSGSWQSFSRPNEEPFLTINLNMVEFIKKKK